MPIVKIVTYNAALKVTTSWNLLIY